MRYSTIEGCVRQSTNNPLTHETEKTRKTDNSKHLERHYNSRKSRKLELERKHIRNLRRNQRLERSRQEQRASIRLQVF